MFASELDSSRDWNSCRPASTASGPSDEEQDSDAAPMHIAVYRVQVSIRMHHRRRTAAHRIMGWASLSLPLSSPCLPEGGSRADRDRARLRHGPVRPE